MYDNNHQTIKPNVKFDLARFAEDNRLAHGSIFIFNPWVHIFRSNIALPKNLPRIKGSSIVEFSEIYVEMVMRGDEAIHKRVYENYTVALRIYLSKPSYHV